MDKNKKESEALFTLTKDLNGDVNRFKNSLAEIRRAICKRVERITKLQDEITRPDLRTLV